MSNEFGELFAWDDTQERILWLSRHAPTKAQRDGLGELWPDYEVVEQNMLYPVDSDAAVSEIEDTAQSRGCSVVVAVLPAHIAASAARRQEDRKMRLPVWVPVNKAIAASEDGKPRPFEHSHFEEC